VALGRNEAALHLSVATADTLPHLFDLWEMIGSREMLSDDLSLGFCDGSNGTEWLSEAHKKDSAVLRVENSVEERKPIVRSRDVFLGKEGEVHLVSCTVDDDVHFCR
jgi:hypothetical protein